MRQEANEEYKAEKNVRDERQMKHFFPNLEAEYQKNNRNNPGV